MITRVQPKTAGFTSDLKGLGANEYNVTIVFTSDDPEESVYDVMSAGPYSRGSSFQYFDFSDPWSICDNAKPKKLTDLVWEVDYHFAPRNRGSSKQKGDEPQNPDPLLRVPDVEWDVMEHWHTAWKAYQYNFDTAEWSTEMKPVVNAAGGRFSQPMQYAQPRPALRYARNEEIFPHQLAVEYTYALNSDTFLGYAPGKVQCRSIKGQWRFEQDPNLGNVSFWRVEYLFWFDDDGLFYEDILNEGYYGFADDGSGGYKATVREAEGDTTGAKVAMTGPFLLDNLGFFLSNDDIRAGNVSYCRFSRPRWKEFGPLNIWLPY